MSLDPFVALVIDKQARLPARWISTKAMHGLWLRNKKGSAMSKLHLQQTLVLSCVMLVSFSSVMSGTAPQLAIGRFDGCNYTSFIDITNSSGESCQLSGVLHRGAGLGPRIPVDITADGNVEAFQLKGNNRSSGSDTFNVQVAPKGTCRLNLSRLPGGQGFTTFAATIFQAQSSSSSSSGVSICDAKYQAGIRSQLFRPIERRCVHV